MFSWGVTVQPREVIVVEITRRTLLETSAVGVLAAGAGGGAAESALAQPARAGEGARQRLLLDFDWRFALGHASDVARDFGFGENQRTFAKQGTRVAAAAAEDFDDTAWRAIRLPHDWAVELPFAPSRDRDPSAPDDPRAEHGFKPLGRDYPDTSVGWYRKSFDLPESDLGKRLSLEFDGVFRDCLVIFNGYIVARNESGYAPLASMSPISPITARKTPSRSAWTRRSAKAGSTKAPAFIAMCGWSKPIRCTFRNGA